MSAFVYGWDNEEKSKTFWLRFTPCTREPKSWKEEVYAAACSIAQRTKKPIWVCYSGGIDSEVACQAFYDQKIPFSVLTLEHAGRTNARDIAHAVRWCRARNVFQKIVTIDMPTFLTSDIEAYAKQYAAIHPFRYLQIKLMELVEDMGGYAVLCSGEQLYQVDLTKPHLTRDDVYLPFSNGHALPLEWCKDNKTEHEPYFHFSTPELCLSYTRLPLVSFVLNNPESLFRHKSNIYTFKRVVYQSIWTDLVSRCKDDGLSGDIKLLVDDSRTRLREQFGAQFVEIRLPVPSFQGQLTGGENRVI
jgi:hypothetical protein